MIRIANQPRRQHEMANKPQNRIALSEGAVVVFSFQ
jgi:hypothetical protein